MQVSFVLRNNQNKSVALWTCCLYNYTELQSLPSRKKLQLQKLKSRSPGVLEVKTIPGQRTLRLIKTDCPFKFILILTMHTPPVIMENVVESSVDDFP